MPPPPLTLETATALLSLANADVWHLDHASEQLLGSPDTLALWTDGSPCPTPLVLTDLRALVHHSDWAALAALWGDAATDRPQTTVVRLLNRHGAWRWLKLRTQVVTRNAAHRPVRSIGLVSDISAKVRHRTHLQLQQTFAAEMAASPDRDTLARAILSAALTLPDLDGGGLYLRAADGGYALLVAEGLSPSFVATVGQLAPGSPPALLVDAGHLVCSFADGPSADRPAPERSPDWRCEPALLTRLGLPTEGIQALVVLPIRVSGEVCACLNLASTHARRLPDATVAFLQTLASQFGLALEHLAAREEAQHQRENIEGFFQTLQEFVTV
ncbi:MAG: GAF domain-containing protein, partial [Rhodoferax sp.]|nr:GAF domain-containing protein [Rhodoferax sp.]MBP7493086.1 GAF domain-containing protein [Rhodoferax sp.]